MDPVDAPPWYLETEPVTIRRWLLSLRWATCFLALGASSLVFALSSLDFSLRRLAPILLVSGLANGGLATWLQRGMPLPRLAAGTTLLVDVAVLTGLLQLTGGPLNPFSVVYGVQVVLAVFTLGQGWAFTVGGAAAVGMGSLVYFYTQPGASDIHHRPSDIPAHLFTLWMTAATVLELAGYFVAQASRALDRRQRLLEREQARAARSDRLAALTTLAAGAAHELSTPLSTIAVTARELERATAALEHDPDLSGTHTDAQLIRTEVDRCRTILDQMSGRAGGVAPDAFHAVDLARIADQVRTRLPDEQATRLVVDVQAGLDPLALPRDGLVQVVTSLVRNAFDAVGTGQPVMLTLTCDGTLVRVIVHDDGPGMPAHVREHAAEPFYSTKEPGRGMGLGLFLARVFAERLGGALRVQSESGTTVVLELPAHAHGEGGL